MTKTIFLISLAVWCCAILIFSWIRLWFFIREITDDERQSNLNAKIQADDALAELRAEIRRFEKENINEKL